MAAPKPLWKSPYESEVDFRKREEESRKRASVTVLADPIIGTPVPTKARQGDTNQSYSNQGYSNPSSTNQGYLNQSSSNQGYSNSSSAAQDFSNQSSANQGSVTFCPPFHDTLVQLFFFYIPCFLAAPSPVAAIASSILLQCHSIYEHGQLSFMNQHQTHRMCARIHAAIELPLAVLLKQRQQSASSISALDEVKLIKLKVHLESAVRLVREQVGARSLSGLLLYQTQAKEFQVINLNLAAAVSVTGHSSYVNNEKENAEDEKKDRVLLAQLVEAAKGRVSSYFFLC